MAIDSPCSDPCGPGCPIRTSADQSLLAAPHGLSQPITSFIASWRQGIHRTPFLHLIHELHHAQGKTPRAELHSISAISIPAITSFTMSYNRGKRRNPTINTLNRGRDHGEFFSSACRRYRSEGSDELRQHICLNHRALIGLTT